MPATTAYTANSLNQYTAVGAVHPSYDGNGNLTSDGTWTLGYDVENRLVSASAPGTTATYAFDGRGRRKSRTVNGATTLFVTDADNREVLEYDGTSGAILRWHAYGTGPNDVLGTMELGAGTRTAAVPDILGSVVGTMGAGTGTLTPVGYLPFGGSSTALAALLTRTCTPAGLTDAKGNATAFDYDRFDRLATTTCAGDSTERAIHDANLDPPTRRVRSGAVRWHYRIGAIMPAAFWISRLGNGHVRTTSAETAREAAR